MLTFNIKDPIELKIVDSAIKKVIGSFLNFFPTRKILILVFGI